MNLAELPDELDRAITKAEAEQGIAAAAAPAPGRRAALPEQQQCEFDLYLKMPYTRRDHPLVAMVQQAFGWTDAEVDALFAEADLV
jgi:hypothetical protein